MADILRIKRRVTGSPGAPASLANAEVAYNEVDHILYYGEGTGGSGGSASVVVGIAGQGLASSATPAMDGAGTGGVATTWSRSDHQHPVDTSRAPLASPAFTGTPTAPTVTPGTDNTTKIATTAFVQSAVAAVSSGVTNVTAGAGLTGGGTGAVTLAVATAGVTNAMRANMAANTISGNNTASAAAPTDLTVAQAMTLLGAAPLASPTFTGTVTISGSISGTGMTSWAASPPPIGSTAASTGAFTTLSASSTVSGVGFTNWAAAPPPIGSTTPNSGAFTTLTVGSTVSGAGFTALLAPYAPLASPALTGTPTAPTAVNGTNTTQLATTAYVLATRLDQLAAPTVNVSFNSHNITNLLDPVNPQDAATKNYVDGVAQGLDAKGPVLVATTGANITLSGTQTIDGVALVAGNRVLVKDQTTTSANGIYVVAAGAWTRATDMDVWTEVPAAFTFVEQGTTNADTGWLCTSDPGGTLGSTAITWVQFSAAGQITAGNGLQKVGNVMSVVGTAGQISVGAAVGIDPTYAGQTSIVTVGTIATGTWNASTIAVNRGGTGATTLTGYIQGNGTSAFTASATIPNTSISGLGTMSTQNATAVAITGGTVDGITFDMGTF